MMQKADEKRIKEIYGAAAEQAVKRYDHLAQEFARRFPDTEPLFFTAPGRTEIIGNHTDHNGGRILAASVDMDTICAAAPSADRMVRIVSEGYGDAVVIDPGHLDAVPVSAGTGSLVAGILEGAQRRGYRTGGFCAFVTSQVYAAAGVSSSASFEMLIGTVINTLFNDGAMDVTELARIGRYAENVWWEKASGLMDQMACGAGGCILLDFNDKDGAGSIDYRPVDFDFDRVGYDMVLINTGRGHADLSDAYSDIPREMRMVARALAHAAPDDKTEYNLCRFTEKEFLERLPGLRASLQNDRAILRALHYYEECRRVDEAEKAIVTGHPEQLVRLAGESGSSSWRLLQNMYVDGDFREQGIGTVAAYGEAWLKQRNAGVCRVHGGGFAGVVMCLVRKEETADFMRYMEPLAGKDAVYKTAIRGTGAVRVG